MAWKKDDVKNGTPEVLRAIVSDYTEMQNSGTELTDFQKRFFEVSKKRLEELAPKKCKVCGFAVGETYGIFDDGSVIHEDPSYSGTKHICGQYNDMKNYLEAGGLEEGEAESLKPIWEEIQKNFSAFQKAGGQRTLTLQLTENEVNWLVWKLNNSPVLQAGLHEARMSEKIGDAKRDQWA